MSVIFQLQIFTCISLQVNMMTILTKHSKSEFLCTNPLVAIKAEQHVIPNISKNG